MRARIRDVVINYEIEGPQNAPVVTFSHSLAATLAVWEFQVSSLSGEYRILRYDTRGHGNSSATPGAYTMEMLNEDLMGLLDYLNIRRTHFVGISMGGMIGQVFAINHPDRLAKLVLCDTTGSVPAEMGPVWEDRIRIAETKGMEALADETLERWLSEEFRIKRPEVTERIREMIVRTPVPGYAGCSRAISVFDVVSGLSKISAPTLIMVGEKDSSTPVTAAETINQHIHGSELFVIPGALHLSNVEGATLFNERLLRFLA
jgi:3-oxoadipate enol-lactonase